MDKMKEILNIVPEDKDSFFENIFCTNNEHALFYLMNYINKCSQSKNLYPKIVK